MSKSYSDPCISSRILLLFQSLPSLVKLGHHWIIKIYYLKARHICTSILNFREVPIYKALEQTNNMNKEEKNLFEAFVQMFVMSYFGSGSNGAPGPCRAMISVSIILPTY